MDSIRHLRLWLSLTLLLGACGGERVTEAPAVPEPGADDVAVFRGGAVTRSELATATPATAPQDLFAPTPQGEIDDWRTVAITNLAIQKSLESGTGAENPRVARSIAAADEGILREAMAHELGWDSIPVSAEEAERHYREHPDLYRSPERIRLQHIFLRAERHAVPPDQREEVRQKLEGIRAEILAGAEFAGMARRYSQSSTAESGGWMALTADAKVDPGFAQAVWGLELEEVSEVIDTPTGFQLAKLMERLPGAHPKFQEVADFAVRRVRGEKLDALQQRFLEEAGPRYGLVRRYERLEDRAIPETEKLVEIGDFAVTFADLREGLPSSYASQLYNRLFEKPRAFLDQQARNRLLVLEANRLSLADRPEVAARIDAARRRARVEGALETRLLARAARIPRPELETYFEQNEARYKTLKTVTLSVIFLARSDREPLWGTLRRAESLVKRIRAGEDFAALAERYSDHYSAPQGGRLVDLTDQGVGRLVQSRALFRRALARLEPGEVGDAMIAECYDPEKLTYEQTGAIIVRLDQVNDPQQQEFSAVEEMVRQNYVRRNYRRLAEEEKQAIAQEIGLRILADRLPPL